MRLREEVSEREKENSYASSGIYNNSEQESVLVSSASELLRLEEG